MTLTTREIVDGKYEFERGMAIRSDGSKANWSLKTGKNNSGLEARNTLLTGQRKFVLITDAIRAVSTFYQEPFTSANFVRPPASCKDAHGESFQFVSKADAILGFETLLFESRDPFQGLNRTQRVWLAPALDCRPLRFLSESFDEHGEVTASFERVTLSVETGEPAKELFLIPEDYQEMPPSQAQRGLLEYRDGVPFGTRKSHKGLLPGMDRVDAKYFESQKLKPVVPILEP